MKEGKIEGIGGRQGRRRAGKIHVRRERGEGQGRKVGKCTSLGYT